MRVPRLSTEPVLSAVERLEMIALLDCWNLIIHDNNNISYRDTRYLNTIICFSISYVLLLHIAIYDINEEKQFTSTKTARCGGIG